MSDRQRTDRYLKFGAIKNALAQSLFFVPFVMLMASVLLSQAAVWADRRIADEVLPGWTRATAESSRAILTTVAGGTITAASIVFSLTLVAVQLASSQFSPRVLRGFLGDRFQQIVMGIVIGTFSYALLVLREVDPLGDTGQGAFLPQLSIAVAIVLSIASLIAVLASIDHTAKSLRVGTVADDILSSTIDVIERLLPCDDEAEDRRGPPLGDPDRMSVAAAGEIDAEFAPPADASIVLAPQTGWITGLQVEALATSIPEGSSMMVMAPVGTYVVEGTPLLATWPDGPDTVDTDLASRVRIGAERTMQQDVSFGIVQLVDIALRALSPGVNDPQTAEEITVRLGALITALHRRSLPARRSDVRGRWLLRPDDLDHAGYVDLAFEPIRRCARTEPRVLETLIRTIDGIRRDILRRRDAVDTSALDHQLDLIDRELDLLETSEDRRRVAALLQSVRAPKAERAPLERRSS